MNGRNVKVDHCCFLILKFKKLLRDVRICQVVEFPGDLIGFHGQTLAHDPRGRGTHQAGSGEVLADIRVQPRGCAYTTACASAMSVLKA